MTTTTPTRIIAPPFLRRRVEAGVPSQPQTQVTCDDGRTYTLSELAAALGVSKKTLTGRLATKGWDYPHVLVPGRLTLAAIGAARAKPGELNRQRRDGGTTGNAPPPSAYERWLELQAAAAAAPLPTRIVAPPSKAMDYDSAGRPKRLQAVRCDNGITYPLYRLAALLGLSQQTLRCRISQNGWDHPNILGPAVTEKGLALDGKKKNTGREGSAEWQGLSGRPRTDRLTRIPEPGRLERSYLHHQEEPCQP